MSEKKLDKKVRCNLVIYFDSELFTLRDFFEFVKKIKDEHKIYPIDVERKYEDLGLDYKVWRYVISCGGWHFTLKYSRSYQGKEANKRVDQVLAEYQDLLREKVKIES